MIKFTGAGASSHFKLELAVVEPVCGVMVAIRDNNFDPVTKVRLSSQMVMEFHAYPSLPKSRGFRHKLSESL